MAITYMTQEGYDKKMAELAHLENVERPRMSSAPRLSVPLLKHATRATFQRTLSMMLPRSVKACLRPK